MKKWTMCFVFVSILFGMPLIGQQRENMDLIARWANGTCEATYVYGSFLFFGNGAYLEVVELQGTTPTLLRRGKVLLPDIVKGIYVSWPRAYVVCGSGGLQIVNVSDLDNPFIEGSYQSKGMTTGVYVLSNKAYLAHGNSFLNY